MTPEPALLSHSSEATIAAASRVTDHYTQALYGALAPGVRTLTPPVSPRQPVDATAVSRFLTEERIQVFHLHWPEWFLGDDIRQHRLFIAILADHGIPIVQTHHNLVPHDKNPRYRDIYQAWIAATAVSIHHSHWGQERIHREYSFPAALDAVIPHAHLGPTMREIEALDRRACERELGLTPCSLRLGIFGNPRRERLTQMAMDAFAACGRKDMQLAVFSLGPGDRVPDDPRISAWPHEFVERDAYNKRVKTVDAFLFPFATDGMLTSGTPADAIGAGRPALISDWPYLRELMGDAGIRYGATAANLTMCLEGLDPARVASAGRFARRLQADLSSERVASRTALALNAAGVVERTRTEDGDMAGWRIGRLGQELPDRAQSWNRSPSSRSRAAETLAPFADEHVRWLTVNAVREALPEAVVTDSKVIAESQGSVLVQLGGIRLFFPSASMLKSLIDHIGHPEPRATLRAQMLAPSDRFGRDFFVVGPSWAVEGETCKRFAAGYRIQGYLSMDGGFINGASEENVLMPAQRESLRTALLRGLPGRFPGATAGQRSHGRHL